jgi:superoxide dismutase, Fe-Mn family
MKFELPPLPYKLNALEPYISAETLSFHHGKHHQAYLNNLNSLISETRFEGLDLETIIRESEGAIFNNAAQLWNHTFYFSSLQAPESHAHRGLVASEIKNRYGSFVEFKDLFIKKASTLFGSGWVWLVKSSNGQLEIVQESKAGNPLRKGLSPVLTCDVWEHAYYLDHQHLKLDYLNAFWNLINWDVVDKRYAKDG